MEYSSVMEYYVFKTKKIAKAAEAWISRVGNLPRIGKNAKTGQDAPNKSKTERWAIPRQRLDGKWVFPRVPLEKRQKFPQNKKKDFDIRFPHVVEQYKPLWFYTQEEINSQL
jgi:hypothetical protein